MMKMMLVNILLFCALPVFAKPDSSVKDVLAASSFEYQTNLGQREKIEFLIKTSKENKSKRVVLIDGVTLNDIQKIRASAPLSRLFHISSEFLPWPRNCPAGTYRLRVFKEGKKSEEQGCLNEKNFAELEASFKQIQNVLN